MHTLDVIGLNLLEAKGALTGLLKMLVKKRKLLKVTKAVGFNHMLTIVLFVDLIWSYIFIAVFTHTSPYTQT